MIKLSEPGIIEKIRYIIPAGNGLKWEVDEFLGKNDALTLAEIELPSENTKFIKPNWLGKEVTGNPKYYNASLSAQ